MLASAMSETTTFPEFVNISTFYAFITKRSQLFVYFGVAFQVPGNAVY